VDRHGTGSFARLPVPQSRHSIGWFGWYREHGDRIRLTGPIEAWERTGRVRRGRDKVGENGNGSQMGGSRWKSFFTQHNRCRHFGIYPGEANYKDYD
jgi:hypothetical protein